MIDEVTLNSWDAARLEAEWQKRVELKRQMVGWWYPSIPSMLRDELIQIQERQSAIRAPSTTQVKGESK